MRFGKLLAAVTQNSRADEPYISYKELKHNLSKVSRLCGKDEPDNSSGDEYGTVQQEILESQAASSSSSVVAASGSTSHPRIVGPQQDFFTLLDQDLAASKLYVQSNVSGIEAMIGEWQVSAVKAGLIFTPQQLDEVRSQLPVNMEEEALVDWLLSLTPGAKAKDARLALVDKYSEVARLLNSLLQYVEVNLTAVRKILKKFDKKIPPEFRTRKVLDYKVHHELFMPSMQHVLVTAVQMQRLIAETVAESGDSAVPISQLGPESLAVLSCVQNRNVAVDDVFGYSKPGKIDVYAKPISVTAATGAVASRLSVTSEPTAVKAKPAARPQQAGLVSRTEEDDEEEAPEGQEPVLVEKSRRRGGRNNRKRGSRKDFETSTPQSQQPEQRSPPPMGKGKAKGKRQSGEESVPPQNAAGPAPCEQTHETMKVAVPGGQPVMMQQQMFQVPIAQMAQPRFTPMYGGLPVFVPKAGHGKGGGAPPIAFGGLGGTAGVILEPNCHANWMPVPMVWPNTGPAK